MNYKVLVAGIVHSVDPIFSPTAYARATFEKMDGLEVSSEGRQLKFFFKSPFVTESVDTLLKTLIKSDSNVEWDLSLAPTGK